MKTKKIILIAVAVVVVVGSRNLVLYRFSRKAQGYVRQHYCQQRRYFKFGDCYRNNRTGDGSRSRYAGFRYHRQDLRRLQLGSNQRTVDSRNGPCHFTEVNWHPSRQLTMVPKAEFEYQKKNYERSKGLTR